jgi:hypothetical protein
MKDILNLAQAVAAAHTTGQLTDGRLLSPTEYQDYTATGKDCSSDSEVPWVLHGVITPEWVSRVSISPAPHVARRVEVSLVEGEEHICFLLIVHHLSPLQHRLVMPLVGESVTAFLQSAHEVPPLLVSGTPIQNVSPMRLESQEGLWHEALARSQTSMDDPTNVLNQLMRFSIQLLGGERIGHIQSGDPTQMVVSAIPPPEAVAWLEHQLGTTKQGPTHH